MKKVKVASKYDPGAKCCPKCFRMVYNAVKTCPACGYTYYTVRRPKK